MEIRNIISVRQLILNENSELQEIQNPKTGKHFFCCGSKRGFLTPNAVDLLSNQDSRVDDFVYAEVKKDNSSDWIPVIYPNPQKQAHKVCNNPLEESNVVVRPVQPYKTQLEDEPQPSTKNEENQNIRTYNVDGKVYKVRNVVSVKELKEKENAEINLEILNGLGGTWFVCGRKVAFVPSKTAKEISQKSRNIEDCLYAEVAQGDSQDWGPMILPKKKKVQHSSISTSQVSTPIEKNPIPTGPIHHRESTYYERQYQSVSDKKEDSFWGKCLFYGLIAFFVLMLHFTCTHSDYDNYDYDEEPIHMFRP